MVFLGILYCSGLGNIVRLDVHLNRSYIQTVSLATSAMMQKVFAEYPDRDNPAEVPGIETGGRSQGSVVVRFHVKNQAFGTICFIGALLRMRFKAMRHPNCMESLSAVVRMRVSMVHVGVAGGAAEAQMWIDECRLIGIPTVRYQRIVVQYGATEIALGKCRVNEILG